ncbi:2-C-methyl-D-erythritol 4-phosphate cytidylyltransferase [Adhaeribacter soli]|uniref:2-C-methyl-D-erythritol 4-phosphate cytidylyltransferase n=1 Tax=Adhaeribacter soli TaxID=2607655 RepID=A0A5N1J696_9BACT|nr:2-C-methyl-D-erythritol 4-phosphate cytidylyltransferase [Adhaeribacter soli]KAA9340222.1 2-C-methyl-D-erythritol 4-phosphate cytidylyltransferase [Adhaeribacter soli]
MAETTDSVIIVAGGSGSRMQSDIPKQFLQLAGKPILMHTLQQFHAYNPLLEMVVVLPQNQISYWQDLCIQKQFSVSHTVVTGGATRFQSVKNGLAAVKNKGIVAVHDGVRPFVPVEVIREAFAIAREKGNGVVSVPLKDSIRQVSGQVSKAVDREQFRLIQTPQCFRPELLQKAYALPEENTFTDDASVVEKLGENINLVSGSYENIKITTPEDLLWAEAFLKKQIR